MRFLRRIQRLVRKATATEKPCKSEYEEFQTGKVVGSKPLSDELRRFNVVLAKQSAALNALRQEVDAEIEMVQNSGPPSNDRVTLVRDLRARYMLAVEEYKLMKQAFRLQLMQENPEIIGNDNIAIAEDWQIVDTSQEQGDGCDCSQCDVAELCPIRDVKIFMETAGHRPAHHRRSAHPRSHGSMVEVLLDAMIRS